MESTPTEINFLKKPEIRLEDLGYIDQQVEVYANLFDIKITKELRLYQYPYTVNPEIEAGDIEMRTKIFRDRKCSLILRSIYGEYVCSGDSIYASKKVTEMKKVDKIRIKGASIYEINFQPFTQERLIKQEDIHKDELAKNFIDILIRDILHSNPNLEFFKGLFVIKSQVQKIKTQGVSVNFYPGYSTSFIETEGGNFLNVTIKNKIISPETVFDVLKVNGYGDKRNWEKIKNLLIGRSFKTDYSKRNQIIDDVTFDRNPLNTQLDNSTQNLVSYYKATHGLTIKNVNQPLLVVKKNGPQGQEKKLFYVPEFCHLAGLDDSAIKDSQFMKQLAIYTKLTPEDRVEKTNEFLTLLVDPTRNPEDKEKLSAKEKSELYGIQVKPLDRLFKGYYMKETDLRGGNNLKIKPNAKVFPVYEKKDLTRWVCFYEKNNYNDAANLSETMKKAAKGFKLDIAEPEWVEMYNKSTVKDWTDTAEEYIGEGRTDYDFAVFLLDRQNDKFYTSLKKHSLCTNGYVSQVIRTKALRKNIMSVCSKILLQINAKLQGASYIVKFDRNVESKKLMIIGIDSSHIRGQRTGVAMLSTVNKTLTNFFSKEIILDNSKKSEIKDDISNFLDSACVEYSKENKNEAPGGIIIYRQGVSFYQKEFLKDEIREIESKCKEKNLNYYYILVNTKTTYKIFEKTRRGYANPYAGLLVIDGITNRNLFEFYIQPQQVTGGTATPTCFHVAYGNMGCPEIIPKLTYDLCHIYSNWQGPVRVPNVIKAAEKLSKMTAKYTFEELSEELKLGQAFL